MSSLKRGSINVQNDRRTSVLYLLNNLRHDRIELVSRGGRIILRATDEYVKELKPSY